MCLLPGTSVVVRVLLLAQGVASVVLVNDFFHRYVWLDALIQLVVVMCGALGLRTPCNQRFHQPE